MPLVDWPRTSAFQAAQPAFHLSEDQFLGAVDGGYAAITDNQSPAYWALTVTISTLESTAGITLQTIAAGLQAGRTSQDYDAMRSIKYLSASGVRFVQINVEAAEAVMGISLVDLRDALDAAT